jgi:serine/threonine-protein kinase
MAGDHALPADLVREQLGRILRSPLFTQAPMLSRLLEYVVERTAASQADQLKEYSIGVEVFDRGPSFDPRTDTIVRVQARRLRSKLQDYYRGDGQRDAMVVELPKGRYAVVCRPAECRPAGPGEAPLQDPGLAPGGMAATVAAPLALAEPEGPSIAVLPFANLSGDSENDYFSDGLTEEIISALAGVPELRVVARTSAFQFRARGGNVRAIGGELGVRSVLEGSVRKDGQRIRVTAQLINVSDGVCLWSHTYDRALTGVFAIQEEITQAIVDALTIRLTRPGAGGVRPRDPDSVEAHELYLKGRYFWNKSTPANLEKCVRHLERAIAIDPAYAAAHAAIADSYVLWATMVQGGVPLQSLSKARAAAQRALALEDLAESHSAMGMVLGVADWNWAAAEQEFRRALHLKPSFAFARMAFAVTCLCPQRRYEEALDQLRQGVRTDPVSAFLRTVLGQTLILTGKLEAAVDEVRQALDFEPNFVFGHVTLALAYLADASWQKALDVLQPLPVGAGDYPNHAGHMGYAHARLGQHDTARRILRGLLAAFPGPSVPGVDVAAIHNALGEEETALDWLARACELRCFDALFLVDDPRFLNLHSHPRFRRLLSQMGLERGIGVG